MERQQQRAWPLVPIDVAPGEPVKVRIDALVAQRLRLFEATVPAATVLRLQAPFQPQLAAELTRIRAFLRNQLRRLFHVELLAMGTERAKTVLAAADVLCSFESYQLLRDDQALSTARARVVLTESLVALLVPEVAGAGWDSASELDHVPELSGAGRKT